MSQEQDQQGEENAARMKSPGEQQADDRCGVKGVGKQRRIRRDQAGVQQDRNGHKTDAGRDQGLHRCFFPALDASGRAEFSGDARPIIIYGCAGGE